ncbi:hypothetical protein [Lyngbya sp. PCC 8106]|nr:hypothetical protein [Lyngbya sp. PCC 8106]EAW38642.1 hypothetical protein L8106_14545 [Lyngbya sp. PCC 8106]
MMRWARVGPTPGKVYNSSKVAVFKLTLYPKLQRGDFDPVSIFP